jgi:hypothetical protein
MVIYLSLEMKYHPNTHLVEEGLDTVEDRTAEGEWLLLIHHGHQQQDQGCKY